MCENNKTISDLAKIENRNIPQAPGSKQRPIETKTLFTFQIYIFKTLRGHNDSESARSPACASLSSASFQLNGTDNIGTFSLFEFFSLRLSHLTRQRGGRFRSYTSFPLVVCRGFGVCQPICRFQHGALLQPSVDSRWTKE